MSNMTPEVEAIGQIHLEGNIIPHTWYQNIKFENGKTDSISILLLAEIVYWYRPTVIRDEATGRILEVRKKFKADALQKNKKALADQFGFTERQVQESLARLEKIGLITRDYRTVIIGETKMGNVLFIKIHPERIKEISSQNCHTYDIKTSEGSRLNVIPPTFKRQTNTENTTKNTTKKKDISAPSKADAKKPDSSSSNLIKRKEHVSTSQEDHQKLLNKYGPELVEKSYDYLNDWKQSKSETDPKALNKHTDYYRIIKWVMKEIKEQQIQANQDKLKLPPGVKSRASLDENGKSQYEGLF